MGKDFSKETQNVNEMDKQRLLPNECLYDNKYGILNGNDFEKKYILGHILYKNNKTKICNVYLNPKYKHKNINNNKLVCKIFNSNVFNIDGNLDDIYRGYRIIKKTDLLNYYELYRIKNDKIIMILQKLEYNLEEHIQLKLQNKCMYNEYKTKLIMIQLIDKVFTLHNCGYIHCNITPSNIMYQQNIGWKLIDFKSIKSDKNCDIFNGSLGWNPPEILFKSNHNIYTKSVDIWSLGLIILYILFGNQPFLNKYNILNDYDKKIKLIKFGNYKFDTINLMNKNELNIYLKTLNKLNMISDNLFDLLCNYMLVYNKNKRKNINQIYNHKWFNDVKNIPTDYTKNYGEL